MGCIGSKKEAQAQLVDKKTSVAITQAIYRDEAIDRETNKFLLLGPGESGKSTLFKQMISLYGKGFSESDRKKYVPLIHLHVLNSIKTLCRQSELISDKVPGTRIAESNKEAKRAIEGIRETEEPLDPRLAPLIGRLWADPGVQRTYEYRAMYYLTDSANYFLDKIETLVAPGYIPTEDDLFRCRTRSTAILEEQFDIEGNKFRMIDVGGQRNERKKWIHCFSGVTALFFVVAMSEYDMVLFEDGTTNRMKEALAVFEEIVNNQFMKNIPVMLFLNKRDLFAEKIEKKVPLTIAFPEYTETPTVEGATAFIRQEFERRNHTKGRLIYSIATCATDKDNVKFVFRSVNDIILRRTLAEGGLIRDPAVS